MGISPLCGSDRGYATNRRACTSLAVSRIRRQGLWRPPARIRFECGL